MADDMMLDTSDLDAILALDDPPKPPALDFSSDRSTWQATQAAQRWASWVKNAKQLAKAGATPAPSHSEYKNVDGEIRMFPSVYDGFFDACDLSQSKVTRKHPAPIALFGYEVRPPDMQIPFLPEGFKWLAVSNQTAGMICHHRYFVGIVLDLTPDGQVIADQLDTFPDRHGHACVGLAGVRLSELVEYAKLVESLGLSAESNWAGLEEACYPLDEQAASLLSDTPTPTWDQRYPPLPDDAPPLDKLTSHGPILHNPWGVWVLGENCD